MIDRAKFAAWALLVCAIASLAALAQVVTRPRAQSTQANNEPPLPCRPVLQDYKWILPNSSGHPLIGTVLYLNMSQGRSLWTIDREPHLAKARPNHILIGEVHDNPDHHAIQAAFFSASQCWSKSAPNAAVYEHIRVDQSGALAGAREPADIAANDLLRRLDWPTTGWPDQSIFQPLFAAAYANGLSILPGEPARNSVRQVAREGLAALPEPDRLRLGLDRELPAASNEALLAELVASHCNMMPASTMSGLAQAQRYRDAHLADAMLTAGERHDTVFLLAGNGHVRSDRGVPWHLRNRKPDASVLTIMLVEVEDGKEDERSYVPTGTDGTPAADLIIFTPRVARPDPCEQMRAVKR